MRFTRGRIISIAIFCSLILLTYVFLKYIVPDSILYAKPEGYSSCMTREGFFQQTDSGTLQEDKYYGNILVNKNNTPDYNGTASTSMTIRLPGRVKLTRFRFNGNTMVRQSDFANNYFYTMLLNPGGPDVLELPVNNASTTPATYVYKTRDALNKAFPHNINTSAAYSIDSKTKNIVKLGPENVASAQFWAHTDYINPKYRLFIADNETDIKDTSKRTVVLLNNGIGEFELNTDYSDHTLFEKNGTAKFSGSVILLEQVFYTRPVYITGYTLYGMAAYGPGYADYDILPEISNKYNATTGTYSLEGNTNYKVGYIMLVGNTNTSQDYKIRIQYDNTYDNLVNKYNAEGPVQLSYANASKYIFFDEPFIARNLYITGYMGSIKVYGILATKEDEKTFKLEQNKFDPRGIIVGGQKCPNVGQMMQKQLQAQQICEALEQKDRVRNKKLAYEKDKVYLKKLAEQDSEIQQLSSKINSLISKKNERLSASAGVIDANKMQSELARIESLRKEAQSFMQNPQLGKSKLNLNVNLDPAFGDIKKQLMSST